MRSRGSAQRAFGGPQIDSGAGRCLREGAGRRGCCQRGRRRESARKLGESSRSQRQQRTCVGGGRDGGEGREREYGEEAAEAAFSERALRAERAPRRGGRALRIRVVASARACAGGCARSAFGPPRQRRRRRCGEEAARAVAVEVERRVERVVLVDRCEDGLVHGAVSARARPRRPLE